MTQKYQEKYSSVRILKTTLAKMQEVRKTKGENWDTFLLKLASDYEGKGKDFNIEVMELELNKAIHKILIKK
jgi:hypothetical protein